MTTALIEMTERERGVALERYHVLRPFLEEGIPLTRIAHQHNSSIRTLRLWVKQYRTYGLAGLMRKQRSDSGLHPYLSFELRQFIEGLALRRPPLSIASIHRREADGPNAVWQADHSQLDILLLRDGKKPAKTWLTTIEDDYSRTIAGYLFSFDAPSSLHTSLALRQAIWRKDDPRWHICGIPGSFYTDNGSDFTSRHLEQVSADLRIRLVFSTPGQPQGRGRIEQFFETVNQMLLCELPGYAPPNSSSNRVEPKLTLLDLETCFREFLLGGYHQRPHSATGMAPQERWDEGGFPPQMPESLEQLDLLLLTVAKCRKVRRDGIRFQGMRYMDLTLAAYVGEEVILRYDPRDMAEIRVFHEGRFLCRAICQELAGETVPLREIIQARNRRRCELRQTIKERQRTVDSLLEARRFGAEEQPAASPPPEPEPGTTTLKRYFNE